MKGFGSAACAALTMVAVLGGASRAQAEESREPIFGLSIVMARDESGQRVVDDAWMGAQIDEANRLFAPIGARFRWTLEKPLPDPHSELHTRADRDALTPLGEPRVIDVFLVRALEDVDEPGRYRMGVCWTGRGGRRLIILSRTARPTVLAHELGHFFGNPHSAVQDNLMSYTRTGAAVFLDDKQGATIRTFASRFLETGRLVDVGPPRRIP